jgi:cytochrome b561
MNTASSTSRYNGFAMALHWVLALALVGIFAEGLYMADLPFSLQRVKLFNWHKWAGICILALSAVRLAWRLIRRPPALPRAIAQAMPQWQIHALHATHIGLYALFFVVPLLGWTYASAAGFSIALFGVLPIPDLVSADKALAEMIKPLHGAAAWALAALVAMHVAAALKHQFIDRDGLLDRMRPGRNT